MSPTPSSSRRQRKKSPIKSSSSQPRIRPYQSASSTTHSGTDSVYSSTSSIKNHPTSQRKRRQQQIVWQLRMDKARARLERAQQDAIRPGERVEEAKDFLLQRVMSRREEDHQMSIERDVPTTSSGTALVTPVANSTFDDYDGGLDSFDDDDDDSYARDYRREAATTSERRRGRGGVRLKDVLDEVATSKPDEEEERKKEREEEDDYEEESDEELDEEDDEVEMMDASDDDGGNLVGSTDNYGQSTVGRGRRRTTRTGVGQKRVKWSVTERVALVAACYWHRMPGRKYRPLFWASCLKEHGGPGTALARRDNKQLKDAYRTMYNQGVVQTSNPFHLKLRNPPTGWTMEEVDEMLEGVARFGPKWNRILQEYRLKGHRRPEDVKDCFVYVTKLPASEAALLS